MATKLKNLRLTSVDLVQNGANQEADICLFKSANQIDAPEPTESPTEPEKNILKRFIAWLEKNPTEAENKPHSPQETSVEKEYATFREVEGKTSCRDRMWKYADAITQSITSIYDDDNLSKDEKRQMMKRSLEEFDEAMADLFESLFGRDSSEKTVEKKRKLLWDIDDEENEWDSDLEDPEMGAPRGKKPPQIDEIDEIEEITY